MKLSLPYNPIITAEIKRLLKEAKKRWPPIFSLDDYFDRLTDYSIRGKMVRSNLVIISWLAYQPEIVTPSSEVVTLAAIQELSESGLLLIDDVMDSDDLRRGKPTIHRQYQALALAKSQNIDANDARKFGENWAITLGDILFFYLFGLMAKLPVKSRICLDLIQLYSHELVTTGSGQMGDVALGLGLVQATQNHVSEINRQKTAHYTICLPLLAGAVLANQPRVELNKIKVLGEIMGEIFQLTDDRLDLFSSASQSGKSQASDAKSGKKTMLYFFTLECLQNNSQALAEFNSLYGKKNMDTAEIETIQQLVKSSGGFDRSEALIDELATQARRQLKQLRISNSSRNQLLSFLEFLITREY